LYSAIREIPGRASASLKGRPAGRAEIARSSWAAETSALRRSRSSRTALVMSLSVVT
jgi:hypothetical protein